MAQRDRSSVIATVVGWILARVKETFPGQLRIQSAMLSSSTQHLKNGWKEKKIWFPLLSKIYAKYSVKLKKSSLPTTSKAKAYSQYNKNSKLTLIIMNMYK